MIALAIGASAALFYFGTGIDGIGALTWLAPLPVLLLAPRVTGPVALGAATGAALLGACNNLPWYLSSGMDAPLWPMGVLIMLCFAVPFGLGAWGYRTLLTRGHPFVASLFLPSVWTGTLYLVAVLNPTGIMGTLAASLADTPLVLQLTSVTGMWGVEFAALFVPAAIATVLAPDLGRPLRLRLAGVIVVVVGLVAGLGVWRLGADSGGREHTVALLSNNDSGWGARPEESAGRDLLVGYIEEIQDLPKRVETVVLPEGEFTGDEVGLTVLAGMLIGLAEETNRTIVVGVVIEDADEQRNAALVVPPEGEPVVYVKHHDGGPNVLGTELEYLPGEDRIGVAICGDLNFSDVARGYGTGGARLLVAPAADERANGRLHARSGVLQTTANGMAMAWAGRTGTLTVSDGYGRVLAERETGGSGEFTRLVVTVPEGPGTTLYSRLGDWAAWMSLALAVLLGLLWLPSRFASRTGTAGAAESAD